MKVCDLTQFYSPLSGGVKRYIHEKINYTRTSSPGDEHVLIVPGAKTEVVSAPQSRIYSIHSPIVSRSLRYRALLNLRAVHDIVECEQPDIIESSDPYQVGWGAISLGRSLKIPVVAFYHSHFAEAHLRGAAKYLGQAATRALMAVAWTYTRHLYNRFAATLVPSRPLAAALEDWGVRNARTVGLGVDSGVFRPLPDDAAETKNSLGLARERLLLLYVGRLAPEKNIVTLFAAFEQLMQQRPDRFALLVIGDGPQREPLRRLQARAENVRWIPYCADASELARYYRAADLFVHPGVQETFGLVALESQACGTPVVGIRGSYMDQTIFHEQAGWARENSPAALAQAIEKFSARDLQTLGAAAAKLVRDQCAWPRVFGRLFCIYREVCANYKKP